MNGVQVPLVNLFQKMHPSYKEALIKKFDDLNLTNSVIDKLTPEMMLPDKAFELLGKSQYRVSLLNEMIELLRRGVDRMVLPRTELHQLRDNAIQALNTSTKLVASLIHHSKKEATNAEAVSDSSGGGCGAEDTRAVPDLGAEGCEG